MWLSVASLHGDAEESGPHSEDRPTPSGLTAPPPPEEVPGGKVWRGLSLPLLGTLTSCVTFTLETSAPTNCAVGRFHSVPLYGDVMTSSRDRGLSQVTAAATGAWA